MSNTKLSFCIPTYNRLPFLKETLESVLDAVKEGIEVVISDNGSTDGTKEFLEGLRGVKVFRFDETVEGRDNIMHVVDLAEGEYCWLLTDDDCIEPGAVEKILPLLDGALTGISVNSIDLHRKRKLRPPLKLKESRLFTDSEECFKHLGCYMGYYSAQIVHRKRWLSSKEGYMKYLAYPHLIVMAQMVKKDPRWLYIHEPLVGYRTDNETFSAEYGYLERFKEEVDSFTGVAADHFSKAVVRKVRRLILSKNVFWQLVSLKLYRRARGAFKIAFRNFWQTPIFYVKILPLTLTPRFCLLCLRSLYRHITARKSSRSA